MSQVEILKHISSFTSDKPVKINSSGQMSPCLNADGRKIQGFSTIIKYLCSRSSKQNLLGKTPEDQAVVGQWLEYIQTVFQRTPKSETDEILKSINKFLEDRVYFTGFYFTVADVVLYIALHKIMENLTFHEKQNYQHLSRWFNQIQQIPEVRQKNTEVTFMKNSIYSKWTH